MRWWGRGDGSGGQRGRHESTRTEVRNGSFVSDSYEAGIRAGGCKNCPTGRAMSCCLPRTRVRNGSFVWYSYEAGICAGGWCCGAGGGCRTGGVDTRGERGARPGGGHDRGRPGDGASAQWCEAGPLLDSSPSVFHRGSRPAGDCFGTPCRSRCGNGARHGKPGCPGGYM